MEILSVILYLLAVYLGGAVATHARIGGPFFSPIAVGVLLWIGLYLCAPRLGAPLPRRKEITP